MLKLLDALEKNRLNADELKFIRAIYDNHDIKQTLTITDNVEIENIKLKLLSRLNVSTDYDITTDTHATAIIKHLNDIHITDNTLVITTDTEHPTVRKLLYKYKNLIKISTKISKNKCIMHTDIANQLLDIKNLQKISNVYIYMIGCINGSASPISNSDIQKIIDLCQDILQIKPICVLDDVQEMFIINRDYSQFDYIIGTIHAIIPRYDTGILIYKKLHADNIKLQLLATTSDIIQIFNVLDRRKDFIYSFNTILSEVFLQIDTLNYMMFSGSPHLFSIAKVNGSIIELNVFFNKTDVDTTEYNNTLNVSVLRATWAILEYSDIYNECINENFNFIFSFRYTLIQLINYLYKHMAIPLSFRHEQQFELWEECNSKCKFCYLGKSNGYTPTDKKIKTLKYVNLHIHNLQIYKDINCLAFIGGEFFQGLLKDKDVKANFLDLIRYANIILKSNFINEIWISATLTFEDLTDLFETLDLIEEKLNVWILTSYDTIGRFHSEKMKLTWLKNLEKIRSYSNVIKINITSILTDDFISKYLDDTLDIQDIAKKYDCKLFWKPTCPITEKSEFITTLENKKNSNLTIPNFYPTRSKFLLFLAKCKTNESEEFYDKLFNINFRSEYLTTFGNRYSNSHRIKNEYNEIFDNVDYISKCGHASQYLIYIDCDKCAVCDKEQIKKLY